MKNFYVCIQIRMLSWESFHLFTSQEFLDMWKQNSLIFWYHVLLISASKGKTIIWASSCYLQKKFKILHFHNIC
ncbi:hypothetical protein X975_04098, partial [Stegodyphus mimosarum]